MAHEIETALFVKKPAWHNLGVVVQDAPTVAEAIRLSGLDWTVGLKELFIPDLGVKVANKAVVRNSDNRVLGVVGPDYTPLQNAEAFEWFNPFLESKGATIEACGSLRMGGRVWILAKIARDPMLILPGDEVEKYILLAHGHDGTMAVHAGFTPVRTVCANTLRMALGHKESKLLRIKHTKNVKQTLDDVRAIIDLADARFEATAEQYRALSRKAISPADLKKYVNVVWRNPKAVEESLDTVASDRIHEGVERLFEMGQGADIAGVRGTWWGAYNAVNEYIGQVRGNDEAKRLDSLWFGQGATLNQKALDEAVQMAFVAA